ncbi:MAG: hypothetical protein BGN88_00915 [Clostridiales bacterium 43-6]|nr:MAG: hypothetical protein BGN88_00915 [Clostridiales bacterium 43-6]
MKKKLLRSIIFILILGIVFSVLTLPTFALEWDGSSSGGGGSGYPAGPNGYAIRTTGDNCLGYRFSLVDKNGNNKVSKVIDVFRNTSYGNMEYTSAYKFNTKYNKKQLINNQNNGYGTSKNSTNCYKETSMGFATSIPTPDGMGTWQNNTTNLNAVLSALNAGNINGLKNGDKIIVEPLYDVRLQGTYHAVTTTELAIYGKYILGVNSDGGSSSTSESWGFISSYTNKYYPNALYTPDGQGLWSSASTLSSRATFYNIINKGYGVGIAYTETKPDFTPNLSVNICEAWQGSKSTRSFHYGNSNGSSFNNYDYDKGYPIKGDTVWFAINYPSESENCYVRQSVRLSGGSWTSREVNSNSNTWYDVALSPTTVDAGRSNYTVEAKVDWLDSNGNVQKYGSVKTFYIPIRPKIYRYQAAMTDITGAISGYSGSGGSGGAVYAGQRVTPKYTYTSDNSWTSYNTFTGTLYKWSGSSWVSAYGKADVSDTWQGINQSSPYSRFSDIGLYKVPKTASTIPVNLTTAWSSDTSHTSESSSVNIPVLTPDVELTNIHLVDENGYYADSQDLEAGQTITVQYEYKNNTNCTVFIEGYKNDRNKISGIYAIPAGGTIYVNGYTFNVPNIRNITIWGGVYLESMGLYNTSYESNGTNNEKTLSCKVNHPLRLYPIAPNASYREGTNVITSYWLRNGYTDNYTQSDEITVRFRVYSSGRLITSVTKSQTVVPGSDQNLVYFKWYVPVGLLYGNVQITADVIQDGISYNSISRNYSTIPYLNSVTPDTQFEKSAPDGYSIPMLTTSGSKYSIWWEYSCIGGIFFKNYFGIGATSSTNEINPITDPTATQSSGTWQMKSGYGFDLKTYSGTSSILFLDVPSISSYTGVQYAYATFPEYDFSTVFGKYRTLVKSGSYWYFPPNGNYGKVHFTPLWYPDGDYTVKIIKSDFWTPSGMLSFSEETNTINIKGNAYDDWYVGR